MNEMIVDSLLPHDRYVPVLSGHKHKTEVLRGVEGKRRLDQMSDGGGDMSRPGAALLEPDASLAPCSRQSYSRSARIMKYYKVSSSVVDQQYLFDPMTVYTSHTCVYSPNINSCLSIACVGPM